MARRARRAGPVPADRRRWCSPTRAARSRRSLIGVGVLVRRASRCACARSRCSRSAASPRRWSSRGRSASPPSTDDHVALAARSVAGHRLGVVLGAALVVAFLRRRSWRASSPTASPLSRGAAPAARDRRARGAGARAGRRGRRPDAELARARRERSPTAGTTLTSRGPAQATDPGRLTAAGNDHALYWGYALDVFNESPAIGAGAGAYPVADRALHDRTRARAAGPRLRLPDARRPRPARPRREPRARRAHGASPRSARTSRGAPAARTPPRASGSGCSRWSRSSSSSPCTRRSTGPGSSRATRSSRCCARAGSPGADRSRRRAPGARHAGSCARGWAWPLRSRRSRSRCWPRGPSGSRCAPSRRRAPGSVALGNGLATSGKAAARQFAIARADELTAIARDPLDITPLAFLGDIYAAQGHDRLAQATFEREVALAPSNAQSWWDLARVRVERRLD